MLKHLPETQSLSKILPPGKEGGIEFARIVNLLLYQQARQSGKKYTTFNDAAGDYNGLDSYGGDAFHLDGTTGYQYKFYSSPLSANHRYSIEEALKRAALKHRDSKLKKWVLVTPDELTESNTRTTGGDVTWFEGLKKKLELNFELEHLGHRKLQGLFLEAPVICLFYYPELVDNGISRRKTIQEVRLSYDAAAIKLYRNINFVGMGIYKNEASNSIPLENIYIPLSVVPDDLPLGEGAKINPLTFLNSGSQHVILGEPGSGKSTLLRFLALAGISLPLQQRYKVKPDVRLPILVTLRRYAEELKSRKNLSLIDYIQESVTADFSLRAADLEFFEYYLQTGQAILLFDGLDELPNPALKEIVRDRIQTLVTTYPGNTAVTTSRIVGYSGAFAFDRKEFIHHRITKLSLPEIEQFVDDWYSSRIDDERDRHENVQDLTRILRNDDHKAIRELAENPLLLTIVTLVHRIDAVLPDERFVLYQKCTETLLNTWHTWKFREDQPNRTKTERNNRRRMEAVAWWMHSQSVSSKASQNAVVPSRTLLEFLTQFISANENIQEVDKDASDLAQEFIEFIKRRAGLLIEVGDGFYSFVHLTFQEYLTASSIVARNESEGASGFWKAIQNRVSDPRWSEVIRLLVAQLKSNNTQEGLVKNILGEVKRKYSLDGCRLLLGLIQDGIEPAEERKAEIVEYIIHLATVVSNIDESRQLGSMLRSWHYADVDRQKISESQFQSIWRSTTSNAEKHKAAEVGFSMGWSHEKIMSLTQIFLPDPQEQSELHALTLAAWWDYQHNKLFDASTPKGSRKRV